MFVYGEDDFFAIKQSEFVCVWKLCVSKFETEKKEQPQCVCGEDDFFAIKK
jgi:hypothetical protein